jgi:predicted DNA-binding protein with PD1-like motif
LNLDVIRLVPGEDLRQALESRGHHAAFVLSAAGSFSRAVLRYADQPQGTELAGPLELLTLSGTIAVEGAHLHATVGDAQGAVRGGHVMRGCIVRTTAEIVLGVLPDAQFRRMPDARTGSLELVVTPPREQP